jgi:AcrR family transcriptional regulator
MTAKRTIVAPAAPAAGTAAALLAAGRRLFAQHGYDATSVRQLTAEAGANLGAVTYHYGSKQALYHAVLESVLTPFADRVIGAATAEGTPLERAGLVVRAYFDALREQPDLPFLLIQEMMSRRSAPAPVTQTMRRVARTLGEMVAMGQADGSLREGDPLLYALSIVAQPTHLSIVTKMLPQVAGVDQSDAATRERVYAHTAAFVQAGLRKEAEA